jgi:hypothetical protein
MSSRKTAANRANSLNSTGPNNTERTRYNATRHGLSGKQVVVQGEDPAAFEALRRGLFDSYKPANTAEEILVEEIAQNYWRLRRARIIEAENFRINGGGADPVIAFGCGATHFDNVRRYMTTIERAYHRAIQQLEKTQAIRAKKPVETPVGFVSQNLPETPELEQNMEHTSRKPHKENLPGLKICPGPSDLSELREPERVTH